MQRIVADANVLVSAALALQALEVAGLGAPPLFQNLLGMRRERGERGVLEVFEGDWVVSCSG
jgi:hypothetical protein